MIDWIAAALNIIGMFVLPRRRMVAMYVFLLGNVAYIAWALQQHVWSIIALQVILVALNIRTIIIWRKDDTTTVTGNE